MRQKGFSLVEFMVAITIGLILIAGIMQVFLSSRMVYSSQDAIARSQESGRLANEFLSRDIRMAGYVGCASRKLGALTNTLNSATDFWYRFNTPIEGVDIANESGLATLPTGLALSPAPVSGTDLLVVRGAFDGGIPVVANNNGANGAQLFAKHTSTDTNACAASTTGYSGLCKGDILVVSDCIKSRIFQATNVQLAGSVVNVVHSSAGTVTPGNALASWGGASAPENEQFADDAEIMQMETAVFYVAVNPATGRSALWKRVGGNTPVELIEGVVNMQVLYGRDTDNDAIPDDYQTATAVTAANAWASVSGVRIHMLVQSSEDNMVPDPQPYTFYGTAVTPTDHRLRYTFVATTGIRSRLK